MKFPSPLTATVRALLRVKNDETTRLTTTRRTATKRTSYRTTSSFIEHLEDRQLLSASGALAPTDSDVIYQENFEDNVHNLQLSSPATTSIVEVHGNKYLQFDNSEDLGWSIGMIETESPLPENYQFSAEFHSLQGEDLWNDAFLIFDYQSPTNFKYAGAFVGQNEWVIGQFHGEKFEDRIVSVDWDNEGRAIGSLRDYLLGITVDGSSVELFVNGESIVEHDFGDDVYGGQVGIGSYNAMTLFDNILLTPPGDVTVPYVDSFNLGEATKFTTNTPEKMSVLTETSEGYLNIDSTYGGGLGVATISTAFPIPENFDIVTEAVSINNPGKWHDGFIVFDYISDSDFKYAGFFTGQNQWVIGHYEGNWGNRLMQVDWDDEGRSIDTGTPYTMHLDVNGSEVALKVNTELIGTADFGESLNDGKTGLASFNATTRFNYFAIDEVILPGGYNHLPYSEDFESGTTGELELVGSATGSVINEDGNQVFKFSNPAAAGYEKIVLSDATPLPHRYNVSADIVFESGSSIDMDGYIIFDYVDEQNFKYAGIYTNQVWVIGQVVDGNDTTVEQYLFSDEARFVDQEQKYNFHLAVNGSQVQLSLDGEAIISTTFSDPVNGGNVGLMVETGNTLFDNFSIDETVDNPVNFLPDYYENFRNFSNEQFNYVNEGMWSKQRISGDYANTFFGPETGELGILTQRTPFTLPQNVSVGTTFKFGEASGLDDDRQYNGYIIFDFVSETDFKYAGLLPEDGKWVIGHYQGDFDNPTTEVLDFTDFDFDEEHSLQLKIYGSTVELYYSGTLKATASFGAPVNTGEVGIGAFDAETAFYDLKINNIETSGPATSAVYSDSVFAEYGDLVD